ncbi:MAG: nitrogenase [Chloroflexales bacterium]|nr:nitrogenase [Chloroflexales bacterium]
MRSLPLITPDSFSGAILAIEGIADAAVLLHGPTGCKFYHGALSERSFARGDALDPLVYRSEFYFGQARVPATYMDGHDYIFGATERIDRLLSAAATRRHGLIALVNAPGAALIGDDLECVIAAADLEVPCLALENPGYSASFTAGFQDALRQAIERLAPPPLPVVERRVNLVGISLYQRHWQGSLDELRRLLGLCGITVGATLSAGSSSAALRGLRAAQVNVLIHTEYGGELAAWLSERYGTAWVLPQHGAPIGFDATEAWLEEVCGAVNADPAPGLAAVRAARRLSYEAISRFHALTGLPKGATFALQAEGSLAYPLTRWLNRYLGMVPLAVQLSDETSAYARPLREYLAAINCANAWGAGLDQHQLPDVVVGSQALIAQARSGGSPVAGVEVALPGGSYLDVVPKKLLGAEGALFLVEQILNGLHRQVL